MVKQWDMLHIGSCGSRAQSQPWEYYRRPGVDMLREWSYYTTTTRKSDGTFAVGIKINFTNGSDYEEAAALYQGLRQVDVMPYEYNKGSMVGDYPTWVRSIVIGSNIPDGTYQLRMLYRKKGEAEWKEPLYNDVRMIWLTIENDHLTTKVTNSDYINTGSSNVEIGDARIIDVPETGKRCVEVEVTNKSFIYAGQLWAVAELDGYTFSGNIGFSIDPGDTGTTIFELEEYNRYNTTNTVSIYGADPNGVRTGLIKQFTFAPEELGIESQTSGQPKVANVYSITGMKGGTRHGINILRMTDGTVCKKVTH